jgi:hypothetical protein
MQAATLVAKAKFALPRVGSAAPVNVRPETSARKLTNMSRPRSAGVNFSTCCEKSLFSFCFGSEFHYCQLQRVKSKKKKEEEKKKKKNRQTRQETQLSSQQP